MGHKNRASIAAVGALSGATLLAAFVFGAIATSASAQTVRGIVVESGTERPIQLATVLMISSRGDSVAVTLTDDNGFYSVTAPDGGTYMVVSRALGYRSQRDGPMELEDGDVRVLRLNMAPRALGIEGVTVSVSPMDAWLARRGFYERRDTLSGFFMTPEAIAVSDAFFTPELFRTGTGSRTWVDPMAIPWVAEVRMLVNSPSLAGPNPRNSLARADDTNHPARGRGGKGGCRPDIYVNDIFQYLGGGYELDHAAPMDEIVAVEIYRGFREPPPKRYRTVYTCGVILIWTEGD